MTDATHAHSNRLAGESSPYLLQHAHNPVDWYPWGEEALARARAENKPILLSVGYAACHWCHVMERESFENPRIAQQMNENFVCIKVDREERPDVDAIYMAAVQAMSGRGGWPMTVFLTPDGRPFFGGTYYPPEDRQGMPGFPRVLTAVAQAYRERPDDVQKNAEALVEHMSNAQALAAQEAGALSTGLLDQSARALVEQYDSRFGGFGGAPKFPPAMALEFLLRCWKRSGDAQALQMVEGTLRPMAAGGMYDQLGGGFHRYSVDQYWLVPHFEKMLYDNALLARVYLLAYQATGEPRYRRTVEETLDWTLREMTHARGGFYSTLDADSEGEEGKFYVWTPQEVAAILGPDAAPRFCRFYDVSERGNFEGKNILHESMTLASAMEAFALPESEIAAELARSRQALLAARGNRVHPGLDDKVLTAWNGLMLRALAEAARTFDRDDYLRAAERNAEFVLTEMRRGDRLLRTWRDGGDGRGAAKLTGYLEDHAAYTDGLLALYEATFEPRWLSEARALADVLIDAFWDEQAGVFYDTAADGEALVVRPRDTFDNATPSGTSLACDVLLRLAALTGEQRYAAHARRAMQPLAALAAKYPTGFGRLLCALDWALADINEVAILGAANDPATAALRRALFQPYLPHMVAAGAAPDDIDALQATPLLEERGLVNGQAAAYVCANFACQAPVTRPEALLAALDAPSQSPASISFDSLRRLHPNA